MSDLLFKQFTLTKERFLKKLEGLDETILDVQPHGFNNNIRWHIGHVLTVTEQFMFGFPKKSTNIPERYLSLFAKDTSPKEWSQDVPSLAELTGCLKEQADRLQAIPAGMLTDKLKRPFNDLKTYGELANMAMFHEAYHLGQIHSLERMILHTKAHSAI
ncbi:DinB family protein [Peribacillus sp. SCS-155]|uniref:DinB family protein n=1 Tax=Peribacillus sedimenti TaxID=3115297 RepID=UPI0039059631